MRRVSDQYVSEALIRWEDDGQVRLMWELQGSVYGLSVAPEMFDQMQLPVDSFDQVRNQTPVLMQLMVFDD